MASRPSKGFSLWGLGGQLGGGQALVRHALRVLSVLLCCRQADKETLLLAGLASASSGHACSLYSDAEADMGAALEAAGSDESYSFCTVVQCGVSLLK